jgi:hypothetical protein
MKKDFLDTVLPLGRVVVTKTAFETIAPYDIGAAIGNHKNCNWGAVSDEDWVRNNEAVTQGHQIVSAYKSKAGERFWIITEADRSCTTVLLSGDR